MIPCHMMRRNSSFTGREDEDSLSREEEPVIEDQIRATVSSTIAHLDRPVICTGV